MTTVKVDYIELYARELEEAGALPDVVYSPMGVVERFARYQEHLWSIYLGGVDLMYWGRRRWKTRIGRRTAFRYAQVINDLEGWRAARRTRSLYPVDPVEALESGDALGLLGLGTVDAARIRRDLFLESVVAAEQLRAEMSVAHRRSARTRRIGLLWVAARDEAAAAEALGAEQRVGLL